MSYLQNNFFLWTGIVFWAVVAVVATGYVLWRIFRRVPWSRQARAFQAAQQEYQRVVALSPPDHDYGDEDISAQVLGPKQG